MNAGLTPAEAVGFSLVVFAGASQLAAIDLLGRDASLAVVVLTAVVINLRMVMYSASIASHFRSLSPRWKAVCSYLLTDQAYAISLARYAEDANVDRRWFYLGVAATIWAVWQVATVAGVVLGASVPDRWGLSFAVPLVFLSLLVPAIEGKETAAAALVGGGVAVAGADLPLNLGLLCGALAGITAGVAVERRADR